MDPDEGSLDDEDDARGSREQTRLGPPPLHDPDADDIDLEHEEEADAELELTRCHTNRVDDDAWMDAETSFEERRRALEKAEARRSDLASRPIRATLAH